MTTALIGIGSNIGDGPRQVALAGDLLRTIHGVDDVRVSGCHRSPSVGGPAGQGGFTNAAAVVETTLSPQDMLNELLRIELECGRQRTTHWGPRTLDLDLLLYDDVRQRTETLQIPHPRMTFRRFVLEPAAEVAPRMMHPICRRSVVQLLEHVNNAPDYIAIGGLDAHARRWLAEKLGCHWSDHASSASPRVVNDYWNQQWRVEVQLGVAEMKLHLARPQASANPKLVIWLDAFPSRIIEQSGNTPPEQLRDRVDEFFCRAIRGPYLRLDGHDRDTVWSETAAAIEAMQPLVGACP